MRGNERGKSSKDIRSREKEPIPIGRRRRRGGGRRREGKGGGGHGGRRRGGVGRRGRGGKVRDKDLKVGENKRMNREKDNKPTT